MNDRARPARDSASGETVTPPLPHTWRPFGVRMAGAVLGAMLVAVVVAAYLGLDAHERSKFTGFEQATLVFIALLAIACWYAVMRNRVTATERGLTVVNGYRRRDFEWAQVLGISLGRSAPWAGMDLSDGTSISVVAIQGADGPRADAAVRQIRALISERSRPREP